MHLLYCGKTCIIFTLLTIFFLHFHTKIFTGVQLLYNAVLVSTVQQSESAIHIHISPSLLSLPPTDPSLTSRLSQSTRLSPWATQQLSTSCGKLHMVAYVHVIANLQFNPPCPTSTHLFSMSVSVSALQTLTFYSRTVRSIATT